MERASLRCVFALAIGAAACVGCHFAGESPPGGGEGAVATGEGGPDGLGAPAVDGGSRGVDGGAGAGWSTNVLGKSGAGRGAGATRSIERGDGAAGPRATDAGGTDDGADGGGATDAGATAEGGACANPTDAAVAPASIAGTWYLDAAGYRLELTVAWNGCAYEGTIADEGGAAVGLDEVTWDAAGGWLGFRRTGPGFYQFYRVRVVEGTMAGRFSQGALPGKPALASYVHPVRGWSAGDIDGPGSPWPRTWDVSLMNGAYQGVLRVDEDAGGTLRGRLKVHAPVEEIEYDLASVAWDGVKLSFVRKMPGITQVFMAVATGRSLTGTFTENGAGPFDWSGKRSQVLGFGLGSRLGQRAAWQDTTRARLANLVEGMRVLGAPDPAVTATPEGWWSPPVPGGDSPARDDNPAAWPAAYKTLHVQIAYQPENRFDPAHPPPARVVNAYVAKPDVEPPPGGFRAVVVANGHFGSVEDLLSPSSAAFWYGDSAARRQLMVLAVEIGHRNEGAYAPLGPTTKPSIRGDGYPTSDWEEDAERTYDVRRAIDYLVTLPYVDAKRILVMGLSLGGEVATLSAAMDPRIAMATIASFSPDLHVMDGVGDHGCWKWQNANIHEYVDLSDHQALIAPRPLLIETGLVDFTFSWHKPPWSADKQAIRRARAAYGPDAPKLVHWLHFDEHRFHVGDLNPSSPSAEQGLWAVSIVEPAGPDDLGWQSDAARYWRSPSLYHLMNEFLPP